MVSDFWRARQARVAEKIAFEEFVRESGRQREAVSENFPRY